MRTSRPSHLLIVAAAVLATTAMTAAAPAATRPPAARAVAATPGRSATPGHGARLRVHLRPGAPWAQRDVPKYTLTVTGRDLAGAPDTGGTAWVFDATDTAAFGDNIAEFHHGVAKFLVPAGTYWVIGEFDRASPTRGGVTRLDFLQQIRVRHNTTVHTAASAATSQVTMATPRPATPVDVRFEAHLTDEFGSLDSIDWFNAPGQIWVSPVDHSPAAGALRAFATEQLAGRAGSAGNPYGYNLDYADPPGIIPPQHYVARPSNLAVITDRYYQDVKSTGAWLIWGGFPRQQLQAFWITPLALPGTQIQYFSTSPRLYWSPGYNAFVSSQEPPIGGQTDDTYQAFRPGEHEVVDWNRYPLHPQPDYAAPGGGGALIPLIPSAIRMGNKLTLTVRPFSDNVPGHLSSGSAPGTKVTEDYQIDQNGIQIAHGSAYNGIPPASLSSSPSVIRFALEATRTGKSYLLSTHTQTVWTWRTARRPASTVPRDWYCAHVLVHRHYKTIRQCSVQPMMTLGYQVHGLILNGFAPAGRQLVSLTVGHLQLTHPAPVTGAKAWASCDGGRNWRKAKASSLGRGRFGLRYNVPRGCYVTLRVSATDAAGGSITETITRAYATTLTPGISHPGWHHLS